MQTIHGDKVPDLAIGRFPVRTVAELELMVNKTLAYQDKDYGRTAVFAADKVDRRLLLQEHQPDHVRELAVQLVGGEYPSG